MSRAAVHQIECLENAYAEVLDDLAGSHFTNRQLAGLLADWTVGPGRRHVRAAINVVDAAVGFECPTCGATPGTACRNPSDDYVLEEFGNPYTACPPHPERRALTDAPLDIEHEPDNPPMAKAAAVMCVVFTTLAVVGIAVFASAGAIAYAYPEAAPTAWGGFILAVVSLAGLIASWLVLSRIVRAER